MSAEALGQRIRVTAVDDHPIVVEGIAALLARADADFEWLGSSTSAEELEQKLGTWAAPPDIVLFDLFLGDGSNPAESIARVAARGIRVVVLTAEARPIPLREAVRAGAQGLILKSDDVDSILRVIRSVLDDDFAVSSELAFALVTDDELTPHLSARELDVLRLLADGVPRKSVGQWLEPPVKLSTVVTYLNRICSRYQEMGREVLGSSDAVREAIVDGFLPDFSERPNHRN